MSISVTCPSCGKKLNAPDSAAGKTASCPSCKEKLRIPEPDSDLDEAVMDWLDLDRREDDEEAEAIAAVRAAQEAAQREPAPAASPAKERDMSHPAWADVPEKIRKRLASWVTFEADEHYLAYYDVWMSHAEREGREGLVVTDNRLVYHSELGKGMVPLDSNGLLVVYRHPGYHELRFRSMGREQPMIRLTEDACQSVLRRLRQQGASVGVVMV